MQIYFSVGEASGDEHAAMLIREIKSRRPDCECVGYGGEEMKAAGCKIIFPLTTMAVMGIIKVLPMLGKFLRLGFQAKKYFREHRPDAVVLVDFPGFNWWIARFAKQEGIPVYYYMPPQLWAWAGWRIKRVQRNIDHVLSGLAFETEWYQKRGVEATFVGHPFFEEVANHPLDRKAVAHLRPQGKKLVGLLPGSRTMEVTANWSVMLETVEQLSSSHPDCHFVVANYKPRHRNFCEEQLRDYGKPLPITFETGKTSEIIEAADCCLMVSGSVSLEVLARSTPAVVIYKAGWLMAFLAKRLAKCQYISLPNLMKGKELLPEFPFTGNNRPIVTKVASIIDCWLSSPEELTVVRNEYQQLLGELSESQASVKVAEFLMKKLEITPNDRIAA